MPPALSKSDPQRVEIHILACGHGDTLLVRLAGPRWALIDCHLPGEAAKRRFFRLVTGLGIRRLEFIILTHPDYDHYAGMVDVVEHFMRERDGVGYFCDTALNWKEVQVLMEAQGRPDDEVQEYGRLMLAIVDAGIAAHRLDEARCPIEVAGTALKLVPIAPPEDTVITPARRVALGQPPGVDINDLSIVLVLIIAGSKSCRQALLAADAKTERLISALALWRAHRDNLTRTTRFDAIKVPHHGSRNGHCSQLCACGPVDCKGAAAISVGTKFRLPKASVIRDYLDKNWSVVSTTKRRVRSPPDRLVAVFGKAAAPEIQMEQYDILFRWTAHDNFQWHPPEAEIRSSEIGDYFA